MDNNTPTNAAQPGLKPVGQTPTPAPAASAPTPATPTPAAPEPAEPTPAEPAPVPEAPATPAAPGTPTPKAPKDKKKTGLIIGIIVGAIVLIGGITAAAIALMAPKPDPVTTAIEKLINHEERRNLKIGGGVKISLPDNPDSVTSLQIDLDSQIVGDSLLNASTITGKVAFKDGEEISAGIDEVYSESGDLYFRLSNAADAIQKYLKHESSSSQDCYAVLDGEDLCSDLEDTEVENNVTIDLVDEIDGEWMRVSVDELGSYMGSTAIDLESGEEVESQTTCVTDFANEIKQNTNGIAEAYKNNPFIKSSQENITVVKKANPIYEITVDSEKLVGFSKQMEQFQPVKNFADCMGMDQFKIDEDKIAEAIEALPKLYLEIDGKYDITRLYFEYPFENVQASVTVDLDFAYPDTVNIAEPKEYKDFSKTIEEFVSKMMMIE